MDHSSCSEANSSSANQYIPRILWNRVHNSPSLFPILSQINPVHILPSNFFNIKFNGFIPIYAQVVILVSVFRIPPRIPLRTSLIPIRPSWPSYLILLYLNTLIILGEKYRTCNSPREVLLQICEVWGTLFWEWNGVSRIPVTAALSLDHANLCMV